MEEKSGRTGSTDPNQHGAVVRETAIQYEPSCRTDAPPIRELTFEQLARAAENGECLWGEPARQKPSILPFDLDGAEFRLFIDAAGRIQALLRAAVASAGRNDAETAERWLAIAAAEAESQWNPIVRHLTGNEFGVDSADGWDRLAGRKWTGSTPREMLVKLQTSRPRLFACYAVELARAVRRLAIQGSVPHEYGGVAKVAGEFLPELETAIDGLREWFPEPVKLDSNANRPATKPDADKGEPAEAISNSSAPKKPKRSTERGEGRAKLIAALTEHHKYANGGCLNLEPVGNNELARIATVEESTASEFFKKEFKGYAKYRAICRDAGGLVDSLKALNGEFSPHDLYGRRPPGEGEREHEE